MRNVEADQSGCAVSCRGSERSCTTFRSDVPHRPSWPGADVEVDLANQVGQWHGLGVDGHGRLRARRTLSGSRTRLRALNCGFRLRFRTR